jgi:hypothetical protein
MFASNHAVITCINTALIFFVWHNLSPVALEGNFGVRCRGFQRSYRTTRIRGMEQKEILWCVFTWAKEPNQQFRLRTFNRLARLGKLLQSIKLFAKHGFYSWRNFLEAALNKSANTIGHFEAGSIGVTG